jgi:mRNA interferase MazF
LILMAVTSQVKPRPGFGEVRIADWQAAGLLKPSVLKPILFTAEKTIIAKTLGRLKAADQDALRKVIAAMLG